MAEVVRYVDPDASGSGTGVDWTNAYTSLSSWEAAEQTDLVSDGDWHHVYCRSGSGTADTANCTINTWTTGVANYVLIEAESGHEAVKSGWDATRYRIVVASSHGIYSLVPYTRFNGLQIDAGNYCFTLLHNANEVRIYNCRLRDSQYGIYISNSSNPADLTVWNTIIEGMTSDGIYYRTSTGTCNVYNSIIYGTTSRGIIRVSGTANAYNTASFGNGDDFLGTFGTIDYCASDDGDGTNSISPSGASWANEFADASTGDFTLVAGGNCQDGGTNDPSSGLYSTDMEGDSYAAPWSVGVDEIVSAVATDNAIMFGANF